MEYNPDRIAALLDVYSLEEVLEAANLEASDILRILFEQGYLDDLELPEPL